MTGFLPLLRKELLEQRRTWKFRIMLIVFVLISVLVPVITRIVLAALGDEAGRAEAEGMLRAVSGTLSGVGMFLTIILGMGAIASERDSGTAAMTLSKPVTRSAFVSSKSLSLALIGFAALASASIVAYLLVLGLFDAVPVGRYAVGVIVVGAYLTFVGMLTLMFSAAFSNQLAAGATAFASVIIMGALSSIPHTGRYFPTSVPEYADSIHSGLTSDRWPALAIACGCIVVFGVLSWLIFRRKEL